MEKLTTDEFKTLMKFLENPTLTKSEKNMLGYLICCNRPFTLDYICQKLDYTTEEVKNCFKKLYKAFIVYESEDGDKTKNRFIFNESVVGRNTNINGTVEDDLVNEKILDDLKNQIEEIDMAESFRNGMNVLVGVYILLQYKRHFVYAVKKLENHSRIWCGQRISCDKYKYSNLLNIAHDTCKKYKFTDAQKVTLEKCFRAIKLNDSSIQ